MGKKTKTEKSEAKSVKKRKTAKKAAKANVAGPKKVTAKAKSKTKPKAKSRAVKAASPPTHETVAARAYELYLARGGSPGQPEKDWAQAEAELLDRA